MPCGASSAVSRTVLLCAERCSPCRMRGSIRQTFCRPCPMRRNRKIRHMPAFCFGNPFSRLGTESEKVTLMGMPRTSVGRPEGYLDQSTAPAATRCRVAGSAWGGNRHADRQRSAYDDIRRSTSMRTARRRPARFQRAASSALSAIPASAYVWSLFNHAPQARETGLLAGEAAVNSLAVNEALKFVFRRDRPSVNNSAGNFFSSSFSDASFPSNHAAAAWSIASVVGEEYPGWLPRATVYGLASAVSVSRIIAEKHFPSDVLVEQRCRLVDWPLCVSRSP